MGRVGQGPLLKMRDMHIIDYLDRGVQSAPHRPCLVDDVCILNYVDVVRMTWRVANALRNYGFSAASRIAVLSPNRAHAFACILGIFRNSSVWVPLNAANSAEENGKFLSKTQAEVLFLHPEFLDKLPDLRAAGACLKLIVLLGDEAPEGLVDLSGFLAKGSDTPSFPVIADPDDLVTLYSTGGTTGEPKAVMFTNRMWATMIATHRLVFPVDEPPVHLVVAPMTHGAGGIAMCLLSQGGTQVFMDHFDVGALPEMVEKHGVTHLFLPPTAIYKLLDSHGLSAERFRSLTHFFYAAAPMSVDRLREAIDLFGPVMVQTYGQTECPLVCTVLSQDDHVKALASAPDVLKSCGKPTPLVTVAIMDSSGNVVEPGVAGEIVVKGDLVTPGYLDDPVQTEAIRRAGWHRTGDVGYFDKDGYLYIVDRLKDMIISGGFNVYPAEVEKVLLAHPSVADCVVVGVPHPLWGEAVKAVIELRPGQVFDAAAVMEFCKGHLGSVKAPKSVECWAELPRSAVGKTLRRKVRDVFWADAGRSI